MNNGLSTAENDELKALGLVLFTQYDLATKRWSLVVNFINPPDRLGRSPPEAAFSWLWERGLKNDKLAQKVLTLINQFNRKAK